jgi:hypothetical protein
MSRRSWFVIAGVAVLIVLSYSCARPVLGFRRQQISQACIMEVTLAFDYLREDCGAYPLPSSGILSANDQNPCEHGSLLQQMLADGAVRHASACDGFRKPIHVLPVSPVMPSDSVPANCRRYADLWAVDIELASFGSDERSGPHRGFYEERDPRGDVIARLGNRGYALHTAPGGHGLNPRGHRLNLFGAPIADTWMLLRPGPSCDWRTAGTR